MTCYFVSLLGVKNNMGTNGKDNTFGNNNNNPSSNDTKFTGPSLASACSNVIKNLLETMNNGKMSRTSNTTQSNRENANVDSHDVTENDENILNEVDEDGDNSDICSLPECDSDLLGENVFCSVLSKGFC